MHTIRGTGLSSIPRSTSVADLLSAAANLVRMGATKVGENELAYKSDYKRKRVEKGYQARTYDSPYMLDSTVLFGSGGSSENGEDVPTIMTEEVFKSYVEWDLQAEKQRSEMVIVTAEVE